MDDVGESMETSHYEVLRAVEATYAPRLRGASLVIEANFQEGDVHRTLRALGSEFRRLSRNGASPRRLWSDFPATMLVGMAGAGSLLGGSGSYWPELFSTLGIANNQPHQSMFGTEFLKALATFDLPRFPDIPRPFVGPILMHAGIPSAAVGDLVELLVKRRALDPGLTAASFLAWGLAPGVSGRLYSVGKPVQYFLRDGDEFALDVIDRLLELIDHLAEHPGDSEPGALASDTTGLPAVTVSKLCRLVHDGDVDLEPARSAYAKSTARRENPRIKLNDDHSTVLVAFPAVAAASHVTWTVFADGGRHEASSSATWVGSDQEAPAMTMELDKPVRRIQIVNSVDEQSAELTLVDPADPLLLFDEDGEFLPTRVPIPRGAVWALWPKERQLIDNAGHELRIVVNEPELPNWPGWHLAQIDTSSVGTLALADGDANSRPRRVRQDALPTIELTDPLPGIRSVSGQPVYGFPPVVSLPEDPSGNIQWSIELWQVGHRDLAVPKRTVSFADGAEVDAFAELPGPLLGGFTLRIRGPLGRKVTRRFWLAEGLSVICEPEMRRIQGPGIEPTSVSVRSTAGLVCDTTQISFGPDKLEDVVTVATPEGSVLPLVVAPPHMATLVDAPGTVTQWSPSMARLTVDQLTVGSTIHVAAPAMSTTPALELWHENERRQSIQPVGGRASNGFRFDLAKFADTARETQSATLSITADGVRTDVASIRPPTYASGIEDRGGYLHLVDYVPVSDVKAALYVRTAP